MFSGSPSPISAELSPCRCGLPLPVGPFTTGANPVKPDAGPFEPLLGRAFRLGV